ncbi:MAG: NapC/NirT family cytochrome c [Ectothiorhodospiraceae bacterium]|nr:NapC/NirT family cytochrome c [Planctomycetota bacterium]MCP5151779.1 NapC/NirT family cytochrome c [Chromatiales bacterium]MCP5154310.1 NapC/NirT family cytochrome c [Ectothiorhodospiraceae bacterium]
MTRRFGKRLALLIALSALLGGVAAEESPSYQRARWDPIHFKPAIDDATDAQCLACHQEIIDRRVRETTPAGLAATDALAWYQTLDTYAGEQETFHRRHLVTEYARNVMSLQCTTCHQGNDPVEETGMSSAEMQPGLVLRKQVDPKTCLMCHGTFNYAVMGIPGPWSEHGAMFADNCLLCHAAIRTNRHQVSFLRPEAIEEAAGSTSDVCYGCHGGRAWYRTSYPYPRHPWPGGGDSVPDWAKGRPTASDPRFTKAAGPKPDLKR